MMSLLRSLLDRFTVDARVRRRPEHNHPVVDLEVARREAAAEDRLAALAPACRETKP